MDIEAVFNQFNHLGSYDRFEKIQSGHINTTYRILTKEKNQPDFVLQKINSSVFKKIPQLIQNKVLVTEFLKAKASSGQTIIQFIPCKSGNFYFYEPDLGYWNLSTYLPNSNVFLKAPNTAIAMEAGKLFGSFFYDLNDFDADKLFETIPMFHDMEYRLDLFNQAVNQADQSRVESAGSCISAIEKNQQNMLVLNRLRNNGTLPLRVTHNDTKLSNALFTEEDKGLAVIDLDTLMPGLVHYDFGDSVRTICSSAEEDEKDLSKVYFLAENFSAFTTGFLSACGSILSKEEKRNLVLGAKYMVFIMGLRFLTDYLNFDTYFTIRYPEHNLVRAKNQFALLKSMQLHQDKMNSMVDKLIN
ncbi:MAG: aminoglycoside phosphotransferase family protein [Bacteroidales bacterium]|nr:aminoglycoside phosphotransferase family protein [Bacteroidales bacterium]